MSSGERMMCLDYSEELARRCRTLTIRDGEDLPDGFLAFNEREVLMHAGKLRADVVEALDGLLECKDQ